MNNGSNYQREAGEENICLLTEELRNLDEKEYKAAKSKCTINLEYLSTLLSIHVLAEYSAEIIALFS